MLEDVNDVLMMACSTKHVVPPTEWVEDLVIENEMRKLDFI